MGSVTLNGSTSGQITLTPPAVAGTNTITLPAVTDTMVGLAATQTLTNKTLTSPTLTSPTMSGAVVSTMASSVITIYGTSQTASGSAVNFTGIPSWVKRITVQINGLSYAAAGQGILRIGSSATLVTTGYTSNCVVSNSTAVSTSAQTDGFGQLNTSAAATTINGVYILTSMGSNTWNFCSQVFRTTDNTGVTGTGFIALAGALDVLSLVATSSTFDAGTINILYE